MSKIFPVGALVVSISLMASGVMADIITYTDKAAYDAAVSTTSAWDFSGLSPAGNYTEYNGLSSGGFSLAGGPLFALNGCWDHLEGNEVVSPHSAYDALLEVPTGATALGMELFTEHSTLPAKFTVTYSDATTQDFIVATGARLTGQSEFWGIVSTDPAVSIVSVKMWQRPSSDPSSAEYWMPDLDLVSAALRFQNLRH